MGKDRKLDDIKLEKEWKIQDENLIKSGLNSIVSGMHALTLFKNDSVRNVLKREYPLSVHYDLDNFFKDKLCMKKHRD